MCKFKLGLLAIFFTATILEVYSQASFGPGYYVNHQNDTIRGFIKYKDNYYKNIIFRKGPHESKQPISPDDAKFFSFSSGNSYQLINFAEKKMTAERVFARVLVQGTIDLHAYYGKFLIGSPEKGQFLLTKVKSANVGERMGEHQKNIGAFNMLFVDCPSVKDEAQKAAIVEESLVELVKKYHECKSLPHREFIADKKKRVQFGVFGSLNFSSISFSGEEEALNETEFETSVDPGLGVLLLFTPSRKHSSIFSVQVEVLYAPMHFKGNAFVERSVGGYDFKTTTSTSIDFHRVVPRVGFRFTARSNALNPYISFGASGPSLVSSKSLYHKTFQINDVSETTDTSPVDINSVSGWIGAGIKKPLKNGRGFFIDCTYEQLTSSEGGEVKVISPRLGFIF